MNTPHLFFSRERPFKSSLNAAGSLSRAILIVTLVGGCGGNGNNMTSPNSPSSTPLSVTSVSNDSPTPLTSLQIATTGVDASEPVSVQFSNSVGFSVTEQSTRVTPNGTVVVGTPLYFDPTTHQIGPGIVSIVLMQSGKSSPPVSLNIQNLPPLSAYGTQPGQISHAFLIFEALLHARRLNELQAAQPLVSSSLDTTAAQTTVRSLLQASVLARNEIDNVFANPAKVISWGLLPDGTALQFDRAQLDVMDRIIAVYLSQQFAFVASSSPTTLRKLGIADAAQLSSFQGLVNSLLVLIASQGSSTTLVEGALSSSQPSDPALNVLGALQASLNLAGGERDAGIVGLMGGLGHIHAAVDSLFHDISAVAACSGLPSCTSTQADAIQSALNSDQTKITTSLFQTYSQVPIILGLQAEAVTASLLSQGAKALLTLVTLASSGQVRVADDNTLQLISPSALPSIKDHWGQVSGTVNITTNLGTAAPQSSLNLCCVGAAQSGIVGMGDPSGNYNLFVPIGVAGTNYSALSLSAIDLLSNSTLASQIVDLTGLNPNTPVKVPTITGSCADNDVSNPDGDDPDCD